MKCINSQTVHAMLVADQLQLTRYISTKIFTQQPVYKCACRRANLKLLFTLLHMQNHTNDTNK